MSVLDICIQCIFLSKVLYEAVMSYIKAASTLYTKRSDRGIEIRTRLFALARKTPCVTNLVLSIAGRNRRILIQRCLEAYELLRQLASYHNGILLDSASIYRIVENIR